MALTPEDRATIAEMINLAQQDQVQRLKCRADYPHEGKLRYARGNPGVYTCECGMRYVKDGAGGLMNAPAMRPALVSG